MQERVLTGFVNNNVIPEVKREMDACGASLRVGISWLVSLSEAGWAFIHRASCVAVAQALLPQLALDN